MRLFCLKRLLNVTFLSNWTFSVTTGSVFSSMSELKVFQLQPTLYLEILSFLWIVLESRKTEKERISLTINFVFYKVSLPKNHRLNFFPLRVSIDDVILVKEVWNSNFFIFFSALDSFGILDSLKRPRSAFSSDKHPSFKLFVSVKWLFPIRV